MLILQDDAYGTIRWKQATDGFADFGTTFGNPGSVAYARAREVAGVETAEGLVPALEHAFRQCPAGRGTHRLQRKHESAGR
jgi:acetolactate synthase-1/2/3 large subunit